MNAYDNAEALLRVLAAPRRNQFFYGKRMDVQHFRMEQDYGRLKQSLINRLTLGKGVVCGLRVSLDDAGHIQVDPGVAIDGLGREIVVPVRSALDPARLDASCCGGSSAERAHASGAFTLWACYRECGTDYQPAMVSDCDTREQCAPGTTVETFCFKLTAGLAPLQGDPAWCAGLAADSPPPSTPQPPPGTTDAFLAEMEARRLPESASIREALSSRRRQLCASAAFDCDVDEQDACVPIAALLLDDGRTVAIDSCLVRPRLYSNAVLLDLILCLAQRIDACCEQDTAPEELLRVAAIGFIRRGGPDGEAPVASVASPLSPTQVAIDGNANAVRIRFTKPFAQDERRPSTPGPGDTDFARHNIVITPERVLQGTPYVPGTLTLEAPDIVRFDLFPDSPYSRGRELGWQKGRYRIRLSGTDDAASGRRALADAGGTLLDGEPSEPSNGGISGDGTAAGDFMITFIVG